MKRFLFLILLGMVAMRAQAFTDDLAAKRSDLVWMMRDIGPLPPDNWTNYSPYAFNGEEGVTDSLYHPMGQFYNVGFNGYELVTWCDNPNGYWVIADPGKASSNLFFSSFGLHLTTQAGYVTANLSMASSSYNVAGLKYNSLAIVLGLDGSGDILGYSISPGQSFSLGAYTGLYTYDLMQDTETPSFKVADYYFGLYPNYPPDSKLPTPQVTQSQSAGLALFVNGVGTTNVLIGWVKEGVYRPGLTLEPGYSSPLLYTYMQQYFNGAWKTDASGNPPRTSTLNWNSVGEVNTNTAVRTGSVDPTGNFIPLEPGKQILTTLPLENGYAGEVPFYALQMQVDQNRDGILNSNDVTSASSPHVFWENNDCDRSTYTADDLWDEQDIPTNATTVNDAQFVISKSRIPSLRDLEDYDRLDIRGLSQLCQGLPNGQGYTVSLRWKTILSGSPGIFVFKSADTNGGSAYLTDPTISAAQIYPTLYPTNTSEPGASSLAIGRVESGLSPVLINDSVSSIGDFFIYCGTSRGSGELAVSVYKNSTLIGETSIFLDIRDVKELYERWSIGDSNGGTSATSPSLIGDGLPAGLPVTEFNDSTSSGQNYILFVHGWNMAPFDKDAFAETAFKRLYWQNYTNRFGVLRWPTTYGFDSEKITDIVFSPDTYDNGELVAWHSAEGLRQLLLNLNVRYPGKIFMLAHSMGNIVAGEALALNAAKYGGGQIVNTYVASQAAVPLHCYDPSASPAFNINFQYTPTIFQVSYPFANWDSGTFNVYPNWLVTNAVSCGARINFFNAHDYALSPDAWQFDEALKPDAGLTFSYQYIHYENDSIPTVDGSTPTTPTFIIPPPARKGLPSPLFRQEPGVFVHDSGLNRYFLDFEYSLTDMYEVMAFASEARTEPLGRVNDGLGKQINLQLYWPTDSDPDPTLGVYGRPKWHSAEFNFNNVSQNLYWQNLLGQNGFGIF